MILRAQPLPTRTGRRPVRPLREIAIENAVEGCVRETFGALTATVQAMTARDPEVRSAMKRIAVEETRHAALGWAIAAWADSKLDAAERAHVAAARRAAVVELLAQVDSEPSRELREAVGLPGSAQAKRMAKGLAARLWRAEGGDSLVAG